MTSCSFPISTMKAEVAAKAALETDGTASWQPIINMFASVSVCGFNWAATCSAN